MPLQTDNLGIVGLGVLKDNPPSEIQPELIKGIHLRWAFNRDAGFPLHGFYLFRRLHKEGQPICLGGFISRDEIGVSSINQLDTPFGQFNSNRVLAFTDDFLPSGKVEIDLRNRDYLSFALPPGNPARQIDMTIGFYPKETKSQVCIRFSLNSEQLGPNPRIDEDAHFYVRDTDGNPYSHTRIAPIVTDSGPMAGLDCGSALEIILPCPSTIVELTLTYSTVPATIEILNDDDTVAKRQRMKKDSAGKPETLKLTDSNIKRLVIHSREPQLLLHQICFTCSPREAEEKNEVHVTGFSGEPVPIPVVKRVVTGTAGDTKAISLKSDSITAVEFKTDAAAALLDLCVVSILQDSTIGWESVEEFPYPLCLPVTHPDYPCSLGIGEDLSSDRKTAKERIFYGKPDDSFTAEPTTIYNSGTVTVLEHSPIVSGYQTKWNDNLVGSVLNVNGDLTAYTIISVISEDKLVLSRNFAGPSKIDSPYAIQKYAFGEFHDLLVHLVSKDSIARPMAHRFIPSSIYNTGTITIDETRPTVISGIGTDWKPALAGLRLQIIGYSDGWISMDQGSEIVHGFGTSWGTNLAGMALHISGVSTDYIISGVDSFSRLVLTEKYAGEPKPVSSYAILERPEYTILSVDSAKQQLTIDKKYIGSKAGAKRYSIIANLWATTESEEEPRMPQMNPLDLVLMSSIHPAVAQMLGLYWIDQTAKPGLSYDYMIVADYIGIGGHNPDNVLDLISKNNFDNIEAYIVYDLKVAPASPLKRPDDLRCYALPGGSFNKLGANNVGLRWKLNTLEPDILARSPIVYNIWRSRRGNETLPQIPELSEEYRLVNNSPVGISSQPTEPDPKSQNVDDWPPFSMHYIDNGVEDGWYSYQISGIDIFGRHSSKSAEGQWYQWAPAPEPKPWYYQEPPENIAIYPSAIRLLDKIPPPAPTGIEAYAIDPSDTTVLKDAAYYRWWNALRELDWYKALPDKDKNNLIGLRVRWKWTGAHMAQAPDIREFRIYYHPDRMNVLLGKIQDVKSVTSTETEVQTDIPNSRPDNAFWGTWLIIGSQSFPVVASYNANPLRLRVKNRGRTFEIRPMVNVPCSISIPKIYSQGTVDVEEGSSKVVGKDTGWNDNLVGMALKVDGVLTTYFISSVVLPTELKLNRNFDGKKASGKSYSIRHPLNTDYTIADNWEKRLYVVGYDEHFTLLEGTNNRQYEIFLPVIDGTSAASLPLKPSLSEPVVYAHIGISAADKQELTTDSPKWSREEWGERYGNEGQVGFPPMVFRVRREKPLPPELPPDSDKVFATRANYHGQSFYTYRWRPAVDKDHSDKILPLYCHLFRAIDDALFKVDWPLRQLPRKLRPALDGNAHSDLVYFPVEWRDDAIPSNRLRRQEVAKAINVLNKLADDKTSTSDAMKYYYDLSNDSLRVLAGLPGNERAFTQLTINPLNADDPANADRRGPDSRDDYMSDLKLRAYVDTLDGRSSNRYFYRAAFIDSAHNQSELSLSSAPVWLPKVTPPRAPVITKVIAGDFVPSELGDRKITLYWASNREIDLKEYHIYRTDKEENAKDLNLMTHLHTESISPDPILRPAEVAWTDKDVPGLVTFYYNLVVVDKVENVSLPSETVSARAFDETFPVPPLPVLSWIDRGGVWHVQITWISSDESILQRRNSSFGLWLDLTPWYAPGSHTLQDPHVDRSKAYDYRIRARSMTGAIAAGRFVAIQGRR